MSSGEGPSGGGCQNSSRGRDRFTPPLSRPPEISPHHSAPPPLAPPAPSAPLAVNFVACVSSSSIPTKPPYRLQGVNDRSKDSLNFFWGCGLNFPKITSVGAPNPGSRTQISLGVGFNILSGGGVAWTAFITLFYYFITLCRGGLIMVFIFASLFSKSQFQFTQLPQGGNPPRGRGGMTCF